MGVPKQMPWVGRGHQTQGGSFETGIQRHRHDGAYDMTTDLRAPFPWPGGKSTIAPAVWARLGDCPNFVEPFCGSSALTLARPHDLTGKTETINDADSFVCNAFRSITFDPEQTAYWCDWPVSECCLTAAHLSLKSQRDDLTARLFADPDYYDAKAAGRWLWGIASWIGDGWCVADGPWINQDGRLVDRRTLPKEEQGEGVRKKMPGTTPNALTGIQAYRDAPGVPKQMPVVSSRTEGGPKNPGIQRYRQGVPKQMPMVSAQPDGDGQQKRLGVNSYTAPAALLAYFERLATRLRRVRILCGDWRRVVKPSITTNHGLTAVFMDSPYPQAEHDMGYHEGEKREGEEEVWFQSARWAAENGDNPLLRIAVAGYFSEATDALFPASWERLRWQARGGYSNQKADGRGRENAKREALWFSPNCLDPATEARAAFDRPIAVRGSDFAGTMFEETRS